MIKKYINEVADLNNIIFKMKTMKVIINFCTLYND